MDTRYNCDEAVPDWYAGPFYRLVYNRNSVTLILVDENGERIGAGNVLSISHGGALERYAGVARDAGLFLLNGKGQIMTKEEQREERDREQAEQRNHAVQFRFPPADENDDEDDGEIRIEPDVMPFADERQWRADRVERAERAAADMEREQRLAAHNEQMRQLVERLNIGPRRS